jgi:hypothetical protein
MMAPLDLDVPKVTFQFKGVAPQPYPAVLNSVWLTPDGRTVVVLINHTAQEQGFEVDLARAPGWSAGAAAHWLEASGKRALADRRPRVTVPARAMRAIEFPNGKPL